MDFDPLIYASQFTFPSAHGDLLVERIDGDDKWAITDGLGQFVLTIGGEWHASRYVTSPADLADVTRTRQEALSVAHGLAQQGAD